MKLPDTLLQMYAMRAQILSLIEDHIQLTLIAMLMAVAIGLPLGILISRFALLRKPVLGFVNVVQSIPSMALLGFAIPLMGIGALPSVVTVGLYALLPIVKNTYTGLSNVDPDAVEAASGIGMTPAQVLFRVQVPQALPFIMSGVRIAAVNSVGFMTLAAYVGAGGLGVLVYSGIRTLNNAQTLAGAIPACLLALLFDYVFGLVEHLVTPISLRLTPSSDLQKIRREHRRWMLTLAAITCGVLMLFLSTAFAQKKRADIIICSKDYTEQITLNCMVADVIEGNTGLTVERKMALGSSQICFNALANGDVDLYAEYSGTMYTNLLGHDPIADKQLVYDTIRQELAERYGITALRMMNFNDTFALAVRPETAEQYQLRTITDLTRVSSQLTLGAEVDFFEREDGLAGLNKKYGLAFGGGVRLAGNNRYTALMDKSCDVIDAYSTDGLLKKFGLICLEDDQNFFVPYFATPMVRTETIERYPEIQGYIEALGDSLSEETMIGLNYQVDVLQRDPEDVAREYVIQNGLVENPERLSS
jgi:osmoprotectant transport system permease protein